MRTIRKSVFETNSSSTHSISFSKKNSGQGCIKIDDDNVAHTHFGEYGWQVETYEDSDDKLSYLVTMLAMINGLSGWYDGNLDSNIAELVELPGFIEIKDCVCTELGVSDLVVDPESGYIDHQSCGYESIHEFLADWSVGSIWDFIFGNVVVHTDNDNH